MRTAIYVYGPTTLTIEAKENNLQLKQLRNTTARTLQACCTIDVDPGIYKIESQYCVQVTGGQIQVTNATGKDLPPRTLTGDLPQGCENIDTATLDAFFALEEAKDLQNP